MKHIFLKPEEICVSAEPVIIGTVLGSCIALCVWDKRLKLGGMNHYVLPEGPPAETQTHPNRYAAQAIPNLLKMMKDMGSRPEDLVIKMVGGSSISDAGGFGHQVGSANVLAAERILGRFGLKIAGRQVGGRPGRKLEFCTDTGEIRYHLIVAPSAAATLIAIGASTGGTQAIRQILMQLPPIMPPIVIVQHIPGVFSRSFAEQLNKECSLTIKEAADGDLLTPGYVYVAPGGFQMKLREKSRRLEIQITQDPPENSFKPSVDYLYRSVASLRLQKIVALLLTGMGSDGAKGLKLLKEHGAYTIVQDEASSVVFGMPKAAVQLNAATQVLPLESMAAALIRLSRDMRGSLSDSPRSRYTQSK